MSDMEHRAWDRMIWILTDEELDRFAFFSHSEDELTLALDLHGMSCKEARRLINNLLLLIRNEFDLLIVHGFHDGCALRDMLWYDYDNRRLSARRDDEDNPGITLFKVA